MAKVKYTVLIAMVISVLELILLGCAEIDPFETPGQVIRHPLGTESIRVGMTKNEVISYWGEPDLVNPLPTTDASNSQGEEWVYKASKYTPVPIDKGYLNSNKYLYFDGKNLTKISNEPR